MSSRGVEEAIKRHGGIHNLPVVDGPVIPRFDPYRLAEALDQEIARAGEIGWTKISLHMDVQDAMKLARFLRGRK